MLDYYECVPVIHPIAMNHYIVIHDDRVGGF